MKIIHVITAFGIGGAEKLLLNVINIQILNNDVHLVYLKPINDLIFKVDKRVKIKYIPLSLFTIKNLSAYYKENNPDIIHTHLGHADVLGIIAAKKLKTKIFCTIHSVYFKKNFLDKIFFIIYRHLFLKVAPKCKVISISNVVEKHVINSFNLPKERSYVLHNAISQRAFKKNKGDDLIELLFVGRLEKIKSVDTLLKAIYILKNDREVKQFRLTIIGDGRLKRDLENFTTVLKIENEVAFKGKQININSSYEQADVFILPSITEGFGIVILEAFRAKLAVVASNIEGPAELVEHNKNGLLFEPKNHIQLAEQIKKLINNEHLRKKLAQKGYETFTKEYYIDNYVKRLNELYLNA